MPDKYANIVDFVKCRERCLFCGEKLKFRLTNFVGRKNNELPSLNVIASDNKFVFPISHTTPTYTVKAEGQVDMISNSVSFVLKNQEIGTHSIDKEVALEAFIDLGPYVQLYCSKKKCSYQYTIASTFFIVAKLPGCTYTILPPQLWLESFVDNHSWIQNDHTTHRTYIHSLTNEDAKPITLPIMDFEGMSSTKLLNRIKTIVLFG